MANDREILREVWEGKLPVCFQLHSEEVEDIQQPEPFYLMVPRMSYLPLITDKVKKYFTKYVNSEAHHESDVWFDSFETPLKWHYPIGVLYDILMGDTNAFPWTITIHFSKFPEDTIFRCPNKETIESHFMSCLKEADALKHRGQVISAMQKKDHTQLWLGLVNDKFDQFWAVNRRLMETTTEHDSFKHIPLRCYNEDGTYSQKLIAPNTETGQKKTFQHLLDEFSTPARRAVGGKTHGIQIPVDSPLQWLSEHLSYPDNFLHLYLQFDNSSDV